MSNEFTGQNHGYERPLVSQNKETETNYGQVRPVWTELMEEMLIYYIRASRLLWDTKHPLFTKPSVKRRKVEDITAIINREAGISDEQALSPEEVWRKFRNLRTYFIREVRKVNESKQQPCNDPYIPRWIHFNRMLFLVDSLKKNIEAVSRIPEGETVNAPVKLEDSRTRLPINSLSTLDSLQQQQQELEDELRIGGEWDGSRSLDSSLAHGSRLFTSGQSSANSAINRNYDGVISRSSSRAHKRARLAQTQEKKLTEVTDAFGTYVTASIRRLSEEKQHALMAKISHTISEFHAKK